MSEVDLTEGELRDAMFRAYLRGYELGYGVEEIDKTSRSAAETNFNRWYDLNFDLE